VRHFQTQCESIPPMKKKCIPLCRLTINRSITLRGRKWWSTQTTNPYSSYRHKGSCRMIAIRNGPHTWNNSIWTLSTRRETPIMLQTTSTDHQSWRWSLCSTLVGLRLQGGRIFTRVIHNFEKHTRYSWKVRKFQNFTSRMHFYATWDTFMFL